MALEVIGSTAAIAQLIGQAIDLYQKIETTRAKVNNASDHVDRNKAQLDSLLGTLQLVQDEKELHTPAIQEQVEVLIEIGKELKTKLDGLAAQLSKGKFKQFVRTMASGDAEDKSLDDLWARMDRAKADLVARIITTHVGLSGTMRDGFTAALSVVQRVDRNVQRVLGQRLAIAAQLDTRQSQQNGDNTVPLTKEDTETLNLTSKGEWANTKTYEDGEVYNVGVVGDVTPRLAEAKWTGAEAHGKGLVLQSHAASGKDLAEIIRARRG